MTKKTIKSDHQQDIISEFFLQNWEFKLKRDLTYLKLLQKKLQKTQIINNIFMTFKINSIKTFIFTLQNSILILALSVFSLYSLSIVAVSSQNKEQLNLAANDVNNVVSLADCDISVSFPKKIQGYETYIRGTNRKEVYKYLDSIKAEKKDYDALTAESLFVGIATSPTSLLPPNYQQDLNLSCGEINDTFNYKKANSFGGDYSISDSKISGSESERNYKLESLSTAQLKEKTNWLIADSDLINIKIYKSTFNDPDQSWIIQFEKNNKRYFVSFYTLQYSGNKKADLEIKNMLSKYNFQFNSVAKSVPNKNLEYDQFGSFQEYGVGGNSFDKFMEKIFNFINDYSWAFNILLFLIIMALVYFSSYIFVKTTKITLSKIQRLYLTDFQLNFISLFLLAFTGQLFFFGNLGFNIYTILFGWQVISSLIYGYIYFKNKNRKYLSMHLAFIFLVVLIFASMGILSLSGGFSPETILITNILSSLSFILIPARFIVLYFDMLQGINLSKNINTQVIDK